MASPIRIKPHHFVDLIAALGAGTEHYVPHPYGHALHLVAARILAHREVALQIELGADDICAPCSHNVGGLCDDIIDTSYRPAAPTSKREWNLLIDTRWCQRLSIKQDDLLSACAFCVILRDRSGDITDIYREIPPERTALRAANLRAGIREFLAS